MLLQDNTFSPPLPVAPPLPMADIPGTVLEVASKEQLSKAIDRSRGVLGIGPEHIVLTEHLDLLNSAIGEPQAFFYDNARSVRVRQLAKLCSFCMR
jgi:hypothetical protein